MTKLTNYILNHIILEKPTTGKECYMCGGSLRSGKFCSKECEKAWVKD